MFNKYFEKCLNNECDYYYGIREAYKIAKDNNLDEIVLREIPWGREVEKNIEQFKKDCIAANIKAFLLRDTSCNWIESLHLFSKFGIEFKELAEYKDKTLYDSIVYCVRIEVK